VDAAAQTFIMAINDIAIRRGCARVLSAMHSIEQLWTWSFTNLLEHTSGVS
jgi:hypothetical protein